MADEERRHLEKMLQIHRANLRTLEEQAAKFGIHVPLDIHNSIIYEEEQIARIQVKLDNASFGNSTRTVLATPPPPPPHFTNREHELDALTSRLIGGETMAVTALQGMGGVGKTALAQKVASHLAPRFPGGVLWTSLGPVPNLFGVIDRWASYTGGDLSAYREVEVRADALRLLLTPYGQILAILDDVWEFESADLLIHYALPGGTAIIVTTRDAELAKRLRCRVDPVDVLSEPDALKLLSILLGPLDAYSREARDVAKIVGYLPLALELVAGVCDGPGDLGEIGHRINDVSPLGLLTLGESRRREESIEACMELSYNSLSEEMKQRFRALGAFGVGPFDSYAISAVWDEEKGNNKTSVSNHVMSALRFLVRRALLKREEDGRYTQHMLLRAYALRLLEQSTEASIIKMRHAKYHLALTKMGDWREIEAAFEQIRHGWDAIKDVNVESMLDYLWALDEFMCLRGRWVELINWITHALDRVQQAEDRVSEGAVLHRLGRVYWMKGDWSTALDYLERSLPLLQQAGNRGGEGDALNYIGVVFRSKGLWIQALAYFEDSLLVRREVGDQVGEAFTLHNIGLTYQKQGYWSKSIEYLKQSFIIFEIIGDKSGQALVLNNLGRAHSMIGQYDLAQDYYQQSLAAAQSVGDRIGESRPLNNLAIIHLVFGQIGQGLESCYHGLSIAKDVGDKIEEGIALNIAGHLHYADSQYDQAIECFKRCLDIAHQSGDLAGEGTVLNNLGVVYNHQEQYSLALDHFHRSLAIAQELGDRNGEAITLCNIGRIQRQLGHMQEGQAIYARGEAILEELGTVCLDGMREWFH